MQPPGFSCSALPSGVTVALAGVWLAVSVFVAIPYWRSVDALPAANPFLEERYALANGGVSAMASRLMSRAEGPLYAFRRRR